MIKAVFQYLLRTVFLFIFAFIASFCFEINFGEIAHAQLANLTPQAQEMYEKYHDAVVQVRVISRASGEKSALGSGFFIDNEGLMVTNYHVVSDAVNYPKLFFVECISADGKKANAEIINIDPVHDLAIIRYKGPVLKILELGESEFKKGTKMFSFGNPYDLGLIIVEGLYNGLMEFTRYPKILFSGSLNPGMSGGPAISENGLVIGVNVSTHGNEISFFVPISYVLEMLKEVKNNSGHSLVKNSDWAPFVSRRLASEGESFISGIINLPHWNKRLFGMAYVPGEVSSAFRCWGESGDNKRYWVIGNYLTCSIEDGIFLSETQNTGKIFFEYSWYQSRDNDPVRFYNIYEEYSKSTKLEFKNGEERDVGKFECRQDVVDLNRRLVQVEFCARRYKLYAGLFDMTVRISQIDQFNQGLTVNLGAMGITENQSKKLLQKFLEEIKWQK